MEVPSGIVSQVKKYNVCDSMKCLPKGLKYRVQFSQKVSFYPARATLSRVLFFCERLYLEKYL